MAFSFGLIPRKKSLQPSEMCLEKRSHQAAFGFWSILCKKSRQRSEMYPQKRFTPDGLQLFANPLRKVPPAFGDMPRKNVPARGPSAFGQSPTKSLSSARRCTSKKYSGQTVFGFWLILCEKPRQPSEIYPGKNIETRRPSAFSHSSTKSLSSDPLR